MSKDWFSAFARKHDTTLSEYRATWATQATDAQKPQKTASLAVAQTSERLGNNWATRATNPEAVAHVAQPLPKEADSKAMPKSPENCDFSRSVAHVPHVAHDLNKESLTARNIAHPLVGEHDVIAWINSHPPDLPGVQNHCAACDEYIPVYDDSWTCLGDGALVHRDCHDRWYEMRREEARQALGCR